MELATANLPEKEGRRRKPRWRRRLAEEKNRERGAQRIEEDGDTEKKNATKTETEGEKE